MRKVGSAFRMYVINFSCVVFNMFDYNKILREINNKKNKKSKLLRKNWFRIIYSSVVESFICDFDNSCMHMQFVNNVAFFFILLEHKRFYGRIKPARNNLKWTNSKQFELFVLLIIYFTQYFILFEHIEHNFFLTEAKFIERCRKAEATL